MNRHLSRGKNWSPAGNFWYGIIPLVLFLFLFFLIPLVYIILASFWTVKESGFEMEMTWTLNNYIDIFARSYNATGYFRSLVISFLSVFTGILIAYPVTYTLVFKLPGKWQQLLLFVIIAPFWTSFIIRAFSWQLFLARGGPLSSLLMNLHILSKPLNILYTHTATVIGLSLFSFMMITLNLYSVMEGIDRSLLEAVSDLGGKKWQEFTQVIFPLSLPGMVLGAILSFIICIGDYIAPTLLGGGVKTVLSQIMIESMKTKFNIPMASAYSVLMLVTILVIVFPFLRFIRRGRSGE